METKAIILTEDEMAIEEWDYSLYFVNIYVAQTLAQFGTFERKKFRIFFKRR